MKVEVLLSCMHQKNSDIIRESNLDSVQTLVINQCDVKQDEMLDINHLHRMYNTNSRGLSKSRNLALSKSRGDICIISDDDERFVDGMEQLVLESYKSNPEADIIIFKVRNVNKKLGEKSRRLKIYDLLRVSSQQITFKKEAIDNRVSFDCNLGAGTGNGGGEENKFLLDCYKRKMKIYFVPITIAEVNPQSSSTWFSGFDEMYFFNLGRTLRYIMGMFVSSVYGAYTLVSKRKRFVDIKFGKAVRALYGGIFSKKIGDKNAKQ